MAGKETALLIFDLDGTLVITGGAGFRAWAWLFERRYGLGDPFSGIDGRGKTDPRILLEVFKKKLKRKPKEGELDRLIRAFTPYLKKSVRESEGYRLVGNIKGLLRALRRRPHIYLALGTGNLENGARIKLSRARLNRYFPVGGFATDSFVRSELIRRAWLKSRRFYKRRFPKTRTFVIGDTPLDVKAGRRCGFKTVVVNSGVVPAQKLIAARPDFFFENYDDPKEWIQKLRL